MTKPVLLLSTVVLAAGISACGSSGGSSSLISQPKTTGTPAATTSSSASSSSSSTGAATTSASTSTAPATTGATTTAASTGAGTTTTAAAAGGSSTIPVMAMKNGSLMFNTTTLHAKAGKVTIAFTNDAPEGHNFTLADSSGKVVGSTPTFTGGTKSFSVTLTAGTYTYYCSVPGHEAAGMKGTLVVS